MFVWPPMPLQPLDDGPDRKLAHSDRLALPMMIAPAAFSRCRDKRVVGRAPGECPGAGCRRHAGGVDVVLDDDRNPEQRTVVAVASRPVGRSCVGAGRRADRDHRVEDRVELVDAPEIEVRQLDGVHPVASSSTPGAPGSSSRRRRYRRPWCASGWPRSAPRRRIPRARGLERSSEQGNAEVGCSSSDLHGMG